MKPLGRRPRPKRLRSLSSRPGPADGPSAEGRAEKELEAPAQPTPAPESVKTGNA
jgi:hypothetical protein